MDLAASALGELDARHRQLTAEQRARVTRGPGRAAALAVAGALLAGIGAWQRRRVPLALTGALVVAVAVLVAMQVLARRRLARAVSAVVPPGPASRAPRCRVCGAELRAPDPPERVARCHYCAADNLLGSSVRAPEPALTGFTDAVTRAARAPGR
jgi:hypothetical protein